jgi:Dyp-type peroxidase family
MSETVEERPWEGNVVEFFRVDQAVNGVDQALRARANKALSWMQPGLIYPAPFQCALLVRDLPNEVRRQQMASLLSATRTFIHTRHGNSRASACVALSFSTWTRWRRGEGHSGLEDLPLGTGRADEPDIFARSHGVLVDSAADAWFIAKADTPDVVAAVTDFLERRLVSAGVPPGAFISVKMRSRTNPTRPKGGMGGRVLGERYQENLRNPASPVEILEHVLVTDEIPSAGGAFVFTQGFKLNWAEIHSKTDADLDSTIGRRQGTDDLIATFDARSHVRSAHAYDETSNTIKLLRIGLPFDNRTHDDAGAPLIERAGGASISDEGGIYFIGMARSAARIEAILRSQLDDPKSEGFARDRLLSGAIARSDLGGFFYAPSLRELDASAFAEDLARRRESEFDDWKLFPAVDWSRLNRHYDKRSPNGWLYYNHKDYLYQIGTREISNEGPRSISLRVQFLLERLLSKWDDTWFRAQKPTELDPLRPQLERFFADPRHANDPFSCTANSDDTANAKAAAIMGQPVAVRAAWAARLLCGLAATPAIGRRGNGGMDICDIHPLDLLAGSIPAQSLAEGRYLIDYTLDDDDDDERFRMFDLALGPNSGVGHVVPSYDVVLAGGLNGLRERIDEAESELRKVEPEHAATAAPFYAASRLAVQGLAEHLLGLAESASDLAQELGEGRAIERASLTALAARLRRLGDGQPPTGVVEALQLILSCHAALHLCGEPVAVGRLDRLIAPFQKRESLSEAALQEAIDCFWLKLGEKTLLNRLFIDDRQEQGNLAMGNRAGPYPKGQSVNQWIQQLTVGGRNIDGSWEYSDVTLACLRAASRLPFNAPVLSLRVGNDMPSDWREQLLSEAARGQLSGGASPILLNDDKIIPGLAGSADNIGPAAAAPEAQLWNSKVSLEDAHNYACDGCYEPQFVGANWFTLGGITLLQMLELALNQGRQIQSAGPVDLLGKNVSFRSPAASAITDYKELEGLFFKHFEWSFAKQIEGTLADFGRMGGVCPSPILSLFINDCLAKGRDMYAGGPRYHVLGPCFTSLANTINSLWAIRTMCFDENTAVTTLAELVQALLCNWGENIIDPLVHSTVLALDSDRAAQAAAHFKQLRAIALTLPRWGRGDAEIDAFGNRICARVAEIAVQVMVKPREGLAAQYQRVAKAYGTKDHQFGGFCMEPGVGTFASYVEQGLGCAASADGRLSAQPLGTDMSPSPSPLDLPAVQSTQQRADALTALEGIRSKNAFGYANGAPFDLNVDEMMTEARLVEILSAFAQGAGSNILTVTTADQQTFLNAAASPESYDLLRVRMGGWTEMFVAMHATHQKVHPRRAYSD